MVIFRFWDTIIEPVLKKLQPAGIVEIGCEYGKNTRSLVEFCVRHGATLYAIDPVPRFDVAAWEQQYGDHFVFYQSLSLNAIPLVDRFDVVLIDGDHNWYTVFHELKLIEKHCQELGQSFPLVMLHDVGWPYGRRDLYYNPENIPEAYRKPYAKKGIRPGSPELVDEGGLNPHLFNSIYENNFQSGVLTAVEDFIRETEQDLEFVYIPGHHGLGVLIPARLKERNQELAEFFNAFTSPVVVKHVEKIEATRVNAEIKKLEQQAVLRAKEDEVLGLRERLSESERALAKMQEQVAGLKSELERERVTWQEERQRLEVERAAQQEEAGRLREELEQQVAALRGKETEVAELKQRLDDKERELAEKDRQLSEFKGKVNQQAQDIEKLTGWVEQMKAGVSRLLKSRRWKVGNALGELQRKVLFKRRQPMVTDSIDNMYKDFQKWKRGRKGQLKEINYEGDSPTNSFFIQAARTIYRHAPLPRAVKMWVKESLFRLAAPVFRNTTAYRDWEKQRHPTATERDQERTARTRPRPGKKIDYAEWIARNDTLSDHDRVLIRNHIASFRVKPKFSILMPVYNTQTQYLREAIDSVVGQLYEDWELCVVDDASTSSETRRILEEYAYKDARIRPYFRQTNGGISACTNTALEMASGDWIVLMDHDDVLSEHALYLVAEAINSHPDAVIIYSDEDHIDARGRRCNPYFKPDWDYDLFLGQNLINHLGVYRADLARRVGGFREGFEGSQDWDFALRVLEAAPNAKVHHIPFILYHWRQTDKAFSKVSLARARDAAQRAVNEHFKRTGQAATAIPTGHSSYLRIKRDLPTKRPLVSIIIPTKDQCQLLRTCIDGLLNRTDYKPVEIVIVDNGSSAPDALAFLADLRSRKNVKVVEDPGPFNFSRLVNLGVAASSGKVCVLLNNDINVINSDWLDEMVSHVLRPEVGAVGAKLYYANDTLQHGGVILGLGGVAGHVHRRAPRQSPGYFGRLNLTHNLSCVTAACLATRREVYDHIGGFDEQNLAVAFNDVDFCIRIRQAGYKIIWTPNAELYHYESLSRGYETTPEKAARFRAEVAYIREQWGSILDNDPFYNPNLALDSKSFDLSATPRVRKPWLEFATDRCPSSDATHSGNQQEVQTSGASPGLYEMLSTVGPDPRRVSAVNFVAVYGQPASGKSSLSRALSTIDGFLWLRTDYIFMFKVAQRLTNPQDFIVYPGQTQEHFSVAKYVDSDSYDQNLFLSCLTEELRHRLQIAQNVHVVLLDGYVFKHYSRIFADLGLPPERTLTLHASTHNGQYYVESIDVPGHRYDVTDYCYDEVLAHIRQTFRAKCLEITVPKSSYQNFESLGLGQPGSRRPDSNTSAKYEASHLDDIVQKSDRFVDIGCNAGYFCFRISEKTNGPIIGIDINRHWLEIASHLNNSIFLQDNITFLQADAIDFLSENRDAFEIIHCASTYHYLRERQVDFLRAAHHALTNKGTLVLEVELADTGTAPEMVMRSRGIDSTPCAFPNRAMFLKQISGLFQIEAEFKSVFQRGSFYERIYFHLRPVRRSAQ